MSTDQRRFSLSRIFNIVSGVTFMDRTRQREERRKTIGVSEGRSDLPGDAAADSYRRAGDVRCPSCDVTHCRHEVPIHCVPSDVMERGRGNSTSSSVVTSPDDTSRASFRRLLSNKDESPKFTEEVELTEEQKAELKQAFSMFEKTGKGKIPARDLGELLRCLGWNPSEQDLEEARHELELTTRGTISFAEVEAYIARRGGIYYGNNAEEDIMVAFQVLDKHGSGKITVSDFRHFMTTMGERMSFEEAEELIARSTQDGKDYIEYRDLVHAVQLLPT